MVSTRRDLIVGAASVIAGVLAPAFVSKAAEDDWQVPEGLQTRMYNAALAIARQKVRGGADEPFFKLPYVDAAFSSNIFYWDTCFIAPYAKYHLDVLPIENALDNFYRVQDEDGFIGREYTKEGRPFWPKGHPVATNPPVMAFAELQVYGRSGDTARLGRVYPKLKRHFHWLIAAFRKEDGLFISDGLGSGMDNIDRHPQGWVDDGQGLPLVQSYKHVFDYNATSARWNVQGRSVDFSAQMALFALNMAEIAQHIGQPEDIASFKAVHRAVADAINIQCWNERDGFYYDLGYGDQIPRKHIGMFWTLIADIVPSDRVPRLLAHLTNPDSFWRAHPVACFPADQPGFDPRGGYWMGGVWAPTNYMVILGLERVGRHDLATKLARQHYWMVAQVFNQTGTFWENYAPAAAAPGNASKRDFCGWTGLVPIAIWHEYIKPDARPVTLTG